MIGDRIRKSRELGNYSLDVFCKKIGVSKRTLQNYEKNENTPTLDVIKNVAKICKVSFNWLIDGKGDAELTDSGISNYQHEESIEKAMEMYKELPIEDKSIIYAIIKRCHLTMIPIDDDIDEAFKEG